jgi:hypothetical protein
MGDIFCGRLRIDTKEDRPYKWTKIILELMESWESTIPFVFAGRPVVRMWCLNSSMLGAIDWGPLKA